MTIIRKFLTIGSLFAAVSFAQEADQAQQAQTEDSFENAVEATAATPADSTAIADSTQNPPQDSTQAVKPDSSAAVAEAAPDTATADTAAPAEAAPTKMRNKITYAEYQAKVKASAKKRSRTLHHGLTLVDANYHDKRYGHMDHDALWGSGLGLYYFYRHYFGHYVGFQGRLGGIYRYSRWTFDADQTKGTFSDGAAYTLTHQIDRKYHNFAVDLPLTFKLGHHVKKTTGFIYASVTFDVTKPIFEMVDTENTLYLDSKSKKLKNDLKTLEAQGETPFPLYESHQTKEFFYMDDWETSTWLGVGVESRLVSVEFQVYGIGGATKDNHRYYHLGHDSNFTWRLLLDFSIR